MTRIGTFSQLEPEIDKDAELSCMPDGKGGIYIAVMKSGAPGKSEVTVMLHLTSRQTLLLSGLLDDALLDDKEEK